MERVLSTVELLELILLGIDDLRSILTAGSRVCRLWNQLIRESPQIQKLLFFRPDTSMARGGQLRRTTRINPLLIRHFGGLLTSATEGTCQPSSSLEHDRLLVNTKSSWRHMLMQQPVPRKFGIWRVETGDSFEYGFEITTHMLEVEEEEGLSMDMLADFLNRLGNGSPWTLFWGYEGMRCLEKERDSLLVRKTQESKRHKLFKMWQDSDVVVKFSR